VRVRNRGEGHVVVKGDGDLAWGKAVMDCVAGKLRQVNSHSGDFDLAGVISRAQMAMGRMYMPARKFPVISHASGVRNQ
jgi:ATP-dependent protease HslVU (ClpYQ) peptidase subunit